MISIYHLSIFTLVVHKIRSYIHLFSRFDFHSANQLVHHFYFTSAIPMPIRLEPIHSYGRYNTVRIFLIYLLKRYNGHDQLLEIKCIICILLFLFFISFANYKLLREYMNPESKKLVPTEAWCQIIFISKSIHNTIR